MRNYTLVSNKIDVDALKTNSALASLDITYKEYNAHVVPKRIINLTIDGCRVLVRNINHLLAILNRLNIPKSSSPFDIDELDSGSGEDIGCDSAPVVPPLVLVSREYYETRVPSGWHIIVNTEGDNDYRALVRDKLYNASSNNTMNYKDFLTRYLNNEFNGSLRYIEVYKLTWSNGAVTYQYYPHDVTTTPFNKELVDAFEKHNDYLKLGLVSMPHWWRYWYVDPNEIATMEATGNPMYGRYLNGLGVSNYSAYSKDTKMGYRVFVHIPFPSD